MGKAPFFEPGLPPLLEETMRQGKLTFTNDAASMVAGGEIVFICVGTPPRSTGEANLIAVENAARQVAQHAPPGLIVVEKSTVPAGTADRIQRTISLERGDSSRRDRCRLESGVPPRGNGGRGLAPHPPASS